MTIDLLVNGFTLVEVPCDLRHRASSNDLSGQLHRAAQYRDVTLAAAVRRARGVRVGVRALGDRPADQAPGQPYRAVVSR